MMPSVVVTAVVPVVVIVRMRMAVVVTVAMLVAMAMTVIVPVAVPMPVRAPRVFAEDERLDRDRHGERRHPHPAQVDVVEIPERDAVEDEYL